MVVSRSAADIVPGSTQNFKIIEKVINRGDFELTMDQNFKAVIRACAESRTETNEGTWIVDEMITAYCELHESGLAHSVEAWMNGQLAGGLYGVSIGRCFFGESMFTRISNASKVAFVGLVKHLQGLHFDLIDCQVTTAHLLSFGAHEIPRARFLDELATALKAPPLKGRWSFSSSTPVQSRIQ